jgi:hypothetical protein
MKALKRGGLGTKAILAAPNAAELRLTYFASVLGGALGEKVEGLSEE